MTKRRDWLLVFAALVVVASAATIVFVVWHLVV
jgi:hypothetical protein